MEPATQQFYLVVLPGREVAVAILTEALEISRMNWWLAWLSTKLGVEGSVSLDRNIDRHATFPTKVVAADFIVWTGTSIDTLHFLRKW